MKKTVIWILCILFTAAFVVCAEEELTPVYDAEGLAAMEKNGRYCLANDIDMAGYAWTPMEFNGVLDGCGHGIYNLNVTEKGAQNRNTIDGNHKKYDTELIGLFSICEGARISNLTVAGALIDYTTDENAFAAVLCAWSLDSVFENVSVSGRVFLSTGGKMGGVAGTVGFGTGKILECDADVTLVYVDTNTSVKCEQFLGGANACGYMDITDFYCIINGYASVHGYVHNGGIVGMHHNHDANYKYNSVTGCVTSGQITFFEHNNDRRAYCKATVGEKLNDSLTLRNNSGDGFKSNETKNYSVTLQPEMCEEPECFVITTSPTESAPGYDMVICAGCGYRYKTNYTFLE